MGSTCGEWTWEVFPFTQEAFRSVFENEYCRREDVLRNGRVQYLLDYLGTTGLDTKTILIEYDYNDGDHLEDFASYYLRCFAHYRKQVVLVSPLSLAARTRTAVPSY